MKKLIWDKDFPKDKEIQQGIADNTNQIDVMMESRVNVTVYRMRKRNIKNKRKRNSM